MGTSSGQPAERPTVLLLSGTHEGPLLARRLLEAGLKVHATVTRPEACVSLFGSLQQMITVEARGFTEESLAAFLREGHVQAVLDATHPFAVRITRIARGVCSGLGVPYVRFERPDWEPPPGTHWVDSYVEAAERLPALGKRAMLTIGAKQLKHFARLHGALTMYARVLPSPLSIQQAIDAGFTPDRVFGLRPPFSLETNRVVFRDCGVDVLVTKASGIEGGVREKVLAAGELGMAVLMIRRPAMEGTVVATIDEAVAACVRALDTAGK